MINQRKIALDALIAVNDNLAYSNLALQKAFASSGVTGKDKPFITALFYGVLDRKLTLDYIISRFVSKSVNKIKPITINSLRIAVFQILFMDKVPDSAAVNESVDIVKRSKEKYNASFVNAVLRSLLREGAGLPGGNSVHSLSIRYSCPEWIINSLISDYGEKTTIKLLEHFLTVPDITVRVNTTVVTEKEFIEKMSGESVAVGRADVPGAFNLKYGTDIKALDCYKNGLFYVQDIQSQTAVLKLNVVRGERVLDMCAAPGGKTFLAAITSDNGAHITSCDFYENRVNLIKQGAKRLKLQNIDFRVCDSCDYYSELGNFDVVICDVPCSGFGVIRRKPEIKYKTDIDLDELKNTQTAIINNAVNYLKPNGRILYSTCTLRKAENQDIVRAFLDKHGDFELKYEHTFLPDVKKVDGFYYAVIKSR
ncbi:MAG: 16S rRNA (cytosine(967)-C(5))-methyltransferase RsmB [Clostridia bacterium]|nr:16S rRNA (cytosine(967)-C(5))-methyltransferase RsmB [Clostridia bacterium]